MLHSEGEARVKSLQKEFLLWVEDHEYLRNLDHGRFNQLRRQAFSSTFDAFRLGRIGVKPESNAQTLWNKFFAWATVAGLPPVVELEVQAKCFLVSLEAFRIGAMVTAGED